MGYTIIIGNNPTTTITDVSGPTVTIRDGQLQVSDSLDQVSKAAITLLDKAGTLHFSFMQPVTITDSVLSKCFSGYVYDSTETNWPPNAAIEHVITCVDQRWLAEKRVASGADDDTRMANQYAGDSVVYLHANYLAAEGVTAAYAQDSTSAAADFATGLLTGVVAASNVGDGNLELAPAGTTVTKVETSTADFNSVVSSSGVDTTGDQLQLASHSTLKFSASCAAGFNNAYLYWKIWGGSYVIQSGDILSYNLWINSSSPLIMCGIDVTCSDGTNLRDSNQGDTGFYIGGLGKGLPDQNALGMHAATALDGYANDQWYQRKITIGIGSLIGKTVSYVSIVFEGNTAGSYLAYVYDVVIFASNGTTHNQNIYYGAGPHASILQPNSNSKISANGYSKVMLTPVIGYEASGNRIATATSVAAATIYKQSLISWTQVTPASTAIAVNTSIDNTATFQPAANFTQIVGLLPGASLIGKTVQTQQVLSLTGKDPTITPVLQDITWTVAPSYAAIKNDTKQTISSLSAWAGLASGTHMQVLANGDVQPVLFTRDWNNASVAGQTVFGGAGAAQGTAYRYLTLGVNGNGTSNAEARIRFDFAGSWTDFTMSIDMQFVATNLLSGVIWGNTSWTNTGPDTYAYKCEFGATSMAMSRGSNGGASSSTPIGNVFTFPTGLVANDWHTVTITRIGNVHTAYIDGVLACTATDGTYTAAGTVGVRFANLGGSGIFHYGYFNNFGICTPTAVVGQTPAPQEITNSVSIGSITVGNSLVQWGQTQPSGGIINVLVSVKGGAYTACTNGGVIPGLSPGTVITSGTVQFKIQEQTPTPSDYIAINGFTWWVSSAYSASGSRIGPGLNLSNVGRAGSALVNWNALVPSGCSLLIDTNLNDKINWTQIGSGAQGNGQIAGISGQPDPVEDTFTSNTSSFYTSIFQTGGNQASWAWNTSPFRLTASGGTLAQLLYSSLSDDDVDLVTDMDTSDAGGLCWRVVDSSNFYDLIVCDASSPTPGVVTLARVINNVRTSVATGSVTWVRGTPHRIRATMFGPVITVSFDGVQVLAYTDNHPLVSGQCGLRTDTVSGASAAQFYFFRVQAQGDSVLNQTVFTRTRLNSTDPTATPQLEDITVSVRSPSIMTGAFIPSTTYSVLNGSTNTIAVDYDDLAKQSNYWHRIDMNRALSFQAHNGTLAPWILTYRDLLIAWPITVKNAGDLYRNVPWVLGGTDTILSTDPFEADGFTRTFTVEYPVESVVSIKAGPKSYTFGIKGVDTGKDFYYQPGNNTFNQDASQTPLPPGLVAQCTYYGQINVVANSVDATEIANQAQIDGTSGIVEVAETAPGLNKAGAVQLASSRGIQYKPKSRVLICTTARTGLAVGQLASVFLPQHALSGVQMLITDMQTFWRTDTMRGFIDATPYFTITAVSGPLLNAWSTTLAQMGR